MLGLMRVNGRYGDAGMLLFRTSRVAWNQNIVRLGIKRFELAG
jgi:hypothetical protein